MMEPNPGESSTKAKEDQDEEMATAEPATRVEDDQMDGMEKQQDRKRAREDDQGEEEEFAARGAERFVAPVSPAGPPWLDSRTGAVLDPTLVEIGMTNELESLQSFEVGKDVPEEEPKNLGKKVINCGWVLSERGPDRVKCRVVAQEINWGDWADVFAATPTTSGQRLLLHHAAVLGMEVVLADVSTAFLHAALPEPVYVRPPSNVRRQGMVWRLSKALYGLRKSPQLFQEHFATRVGVLGWKRLVADAQVFVHPRGWLMSAHVDDLLVVVPQADVANMKKEMESQFKIKWTEQLRTDRWAKYLGREWRKAVTGTGFDVRIPASYYDRLLKDHRLEACKSVSTPFVTAGHSYGSSAKVEDIALDDAHAYQFRHSVGQLMWLLPERADLSFAVKELARHVQAPGESHWADLKRVLRYVKGTVDMVMNLRIDTNALANEIVTTCDASWASDGACKSTSGGVVQLQGFTLLHWSRTQATVAQSSCESELLALNTGGTESKFIQTMLREIGEEVKIRLRSDSTSGIATTSRRGLGRLRHLAVKDLWLQDQVKDGEITVDYVNTATNIADVLTKGLPAPRVRSAT